MIQEIFGTAPRGSVATLPSNLVPDTQDGRRTALDLLCIDLELRATSDSNAWAFGPEADRNLAAEIDHTKAHVFVTVSEAAPQVRPVASRPWSAPCAPAWEKPGYRPDWSRLPVDAWVLVWDRKT